MMQVKELIEILKTFDGDALVVVSSDGEGNTHSPLAGVEASKYLPETTWSGECPHPNDVNDEEYSPEQLAKMIDAVCLSPTN